ncbi:Transposable element P transposase, partial [Frankliniella fusca]
FFGERVATSMEYYRAMGDERLKDAEPTIEFIRRMNSVVDAMNGQLPWQGLRADPNSAHHKVLIEFLDYLKTMNDLAILKHDSVGTGKRKKANKPHVSFPDEISTSYLGLVVTVNTALSLVKYLSQECGYKYLMTRRINQDSLEHFFGHVRVACGANNHPDPLLFINVYRLLMTYSLVKPPRGSNVSGGEMLEALLQMKDLEGEKYEENRKQLEAKIDKYLDQDVKVEELAEMDHQDALAAPIDQNALTVFGGDEPRADPSDHDFLLSVWDEAAERWVPAEDPGTAPEAGSGKEDIIPGTPRTPEPPAGQAAAPTSQPAAGQTPPVPSRIRSPAPAARRQLSWANPPGPAAAATCKQNSQTRDTRSIRGGAEPCTSCIPIHAAEYAAVRREAAQLAREAAQDAALAAALAAALRVEEELERQHFEEAEEIAAEYLAQCAAALALEIQGSWDAQ